MEEPIFPRTGKRVVPLASLVDDYDATVVRARTYRDSTSRRSSSTVRLMVQLTLLLSASFLIHLVEQKSVNHPESAEPQSLTEYEILPASLVRANPFPEYTITLLKGEWVDTRIVIRPNQEVWIEYAEDFATSPWAVKTNAADESACPGYCRIVSNRWDEGHGGPITTNYLLGDLYQDTLKMALYWKNDEAVTLNIVIRDVDYRPTP